MPRTRTKNLQLHNNNSQRLQYHVSSPRPLMKSMQSHQRSIPPQEQPNSQPGDTSRNITYIKRLLVINNTIRTIKIWNQQQLIEEKRFGRLNKQEIGWRHKPMISLQFFHCEGVLQHHNPMHSSR